MNEVFFSFIIGLFVTLVLVPPLMWLAVPLKLTDIPDDRKIHNGIVPRCGGIAMAVGTAVAILMGSPIDSQFGSLLAGGAIIVLFGVWDDRTELTYQWKLAGQLIAVIVLIQGGVVLDQLPFVGLDPVPPYISYPITALFVLGITNAVNLTDGLDGLAAGCALLTLGMIALLGYQGGGQELVVIAFALMGSLIGFLRYNTHPAIVFMGDAGSQLLGFAIAGLTVQLMNGVDSAVSPALPLLLLGLPILDVLWVVIERLREGRSPFRPDRSHMHHKLLEIGFRHGEAVALVYLFHGGLVTLAFVLKYESDVVIVSTFAVFSVLVVSTFYWAKSHGWTPHGGANRRLKSFHKTRAWLDSLTWLSAFTARGTAAAIGLFLIGGASIAREVPMDVSLVSLAIVAVLIIAALSMRPLIGTFTRVGLYIASALVVFLITPIPEGLWISDRMIDAYCGLFLGGMATFYYFNQQQYFRVTSQDLLVLLFAVVALNISPKLIEGFPIGSITFRLIVLFYAVEMLLNPLSHSTRDVQSCRALRIIASLCFFIVGVKGLFYSEVLLASSTPG